MIVKMIQDLWKIMEAKIEKMQEMFTKDVEELKNKQTEMNNTLERIKSRITVDRMMTVKMTQDLRKGMKARIEKMQEMFTKDLEKLKNKQTEMSNTLEGINSRITEAKEWINDLEDRTVEITATEQNIEKRMKTNED